ncbi:MAG TPA: prolipoprotein diacylglyceryl transferase [Candidatus Nitrosotalea sp.]|jgi:phosphatidylglycerol:prolipoprotein diacylglycerol transferase|nr:prolipoprotein diacylglyceryl transferase [Candidatus Nitrosotalea sp.]
MFHSPGAIAIHVGPIALRWYGILMALAMALGLWLGHRDARDRGLDPESLLKAGELALLGGLIGARLYYVMFNLDYYSQYPGKIFAVWEGGLAIHGGVVAGVLVGGLYAWRRHLPLRQFLDVAAPSLALGQAIGRWGNFFNEEAFGRPTDLPWKLFISPPNRPLQYAQSEYFHPTFLYESLWDLIVFLLLYLTLRDRLKRAPGALFLAYLGLYSLGRLFTEGLRTDPLMLGSLRIAQIVSLVGMAVAAVGVPLLLRQRRRPA